MPVARRLTKVPAFAEEEDGDGVLVTLYSGDKEFPLSMSWNLLQLALARGEKLLRKHNKRTERVLAAMRASDAEH